MCFCLKSDRANQQLLDTAPVAARRCGREKGDEKEAAAAAAAAAATGGSEMGAAGGGARRKGPLACET